MSSLSPGRSPALYEGPTSLTFDRNTPCKNHTYVSSFLTAHQYIEGHSLPERF